MGMMTRRNVKQRAVKKTAPVNRVIVEKPTEKVATVEYTKTIINRMSKDDLVALAIKQGIENAKEISGADLKKALIEKFGL